MPRLGGAVALDALDEHAPVPGAVEDRDLPVLGEPPPEAEQVVALAVVAVRSGDRPDHVATRVEALGQPLDGAALAGGIRPLEDDDDGQPVRVDPVAEEVQPALERLELAAVLGTRELQGEVELVEHTVRHLGAGELWLGAASACASRAAAGAWDGGRERVRAGGTRTASRSSTRGRSPEDLDARVVAVGGLDDGPGAGGFPVRASISSTALWYFP